MPLFPFRVNIFKLQEQDVMKKFTARTFLQDIIASSRWSAIHTRAHAHAQTHTHWIDRGPRHWLRCSPKHVRSSVWRKEEEQINYPGSRKGKADSAVLCMCCRGHVVHTIGQPRNQNPACPSWPDLRTKQFTQVLHLSGLPRPPHLSWDSDILGKRLQRTRILLLQVNLQVCVTSYCKPRPNS